MYSRKIQKFARKIYYKYFAKINYFTVNLREGLSEKEQDIFNNHQQLLRNGAWKKDINKNESKRKILEIGFGTGTHLTYLSQKLENEDVSIFGVELAKLSTARMLKVIDDLKLSNLKLIVEDARILVNGLEEKSIDQLFILFPDPWPKKRNYKKRLLNYKFLKQLVSKIKMNGKIIIATDIETYQNQIEEVLELLQNERLLSFKRIKESGSDEDLKEVFETKFAQRAVREGRSNVVYSIRVK